MTIEVSGAPSETSAEAQIAEDNGDDHDDANDVEDVHPNSPSK
jgi:hypothetical protein